MAKAKAKTTKAVKVTDNTATVADERSPGQIARENLLASMTPEELKAAGIKILKAKEPEGPTNQALFDAATKEFEDNVLPNIQEMLDGCNFPGAYQLQIGVTNEGKFEHKAKRVRKPYAARKGSEAAAE